jgi:DNA-binding CsgD family transcriptional regulator
MIYQALFFQKEGVALLWNLFDTFYDKFKDYSKFSFAFIGFGLINRWRYWLIESVPLGTPLFDFDSRLFDSHMFYSIVKICLFFVLAFFARRFAPYYQRRMFSTVAVVSLVVGTFLSFASRNLLVGTPLLLVGTCLETFGYVVFLILWMELYGCISPINVTIACAGSSIANTVLWAILEGLPPVADLCVLSLIPFISLFMMVRGFRQIPIHRVPRRGAAIPDNKMLNKLLLWIIAAAFLYGFALQFVADAYTLTAYIGRLSFVLFVFVGVFVFKNSLSIKNIYRALLPFVFIGFVGATLMAEAPFLPLFLINVGSEFYQMIIFIIACGIAYRSRCSAAYAGSLATGTMMLMLYAGEVAGDFVLTSNYLSPLGTVVLIALMFLAIVLVSTLIFNEQDFDVLSGLTDYPLKGKSGRNSIALDDIATKYSLSKSERIILKFMARGMANNDIASELFIAPGTARAHVSNIYTKLGVHDRESLQDMLSTED